MTLQDLERAKAFFSAKLAFTTGPIELDGLRQRGEDIVIVDVRLPNDYQLGHIPGAINLPQAKWETAEGLSRDKLNVVYCYSQTCHLAAQAALDFVARGYPVQEMEGGFAAWRANNLAIEGEPLARAA